MIIKHLVLLYGSRTFGPRTSPLLFAALTDNPMILHESKTKIKNMEKIFMKNIRCTWTGADRYYKPWNAHICLSCGSSWVVLVGAPSYSGDGSCTEFYIIIWVATHAPNGLVHPVFWNHYRKQRTYFRFAKLGYTQVPKNLVWVSIADRIKCIKIYILCIFQNSYTFCGTHEYRSFDFSSRSIENKVLNFKTGCTSFLNNPWTN